MQAEATHSKLYNKRHGGPYDRGDADSFYGRRYNPHYYVGATHTTPLVELEDMTAAQIIAYTAGFNYNEASGAKKDE